LFEAMTKVTEERLVEIKNQVKSLGYAAIKHTADGSEQFAAWYKEVFRETVCTTCPSGIDKAYNKLLNLNIKTFTQMENSRFQFKRKGGSLRFTRPPKGVPEIVSANNLTDEIAERIIAHNPKYAKVLIDRDPSAHVAAEEQAPPAATEEEIRLEEIESANTLPELKEKLTKLKVKFSARAGKTELVKLLAENEKPAAK
jgi:hypothetical protein